MITIHPLPWDSRWSSPCTASADNGAFEAERRCAPHVTACSKFVIPEGKGQGQGFRVTLFRIPFNKTARDAYQPHSTNSSAFINPHVPHGCCATSRLRTWMWVRAIISVVVRAMPSCKL